MTVQTSAPIRRRITVEASQQTAFDVFTGRIASWWKPEHHIGADWTFDPDLVTEVEIRFVAETPTTTRVELEHRGLERFGGAAPAMREAMGSPEGWGGLVARFADAIRSDG